MLHMDPLHLELPVPVPVPAVPEVVLVLLRKVVVGNRYDLCKHFEALWSGHQFHSSVAIKC